MTIESIPGALLKVLLVEDEVSLADTLLLSLQKLGYECTWARTLKEARAALSAAATSRKFEVMILDRQLPDGEGLSLLASPDRGVTLALVLSSKSSVEERVAGLKAGADDYLPKPFSFHELAARLEALQRRKPAASVSSPPSSEPLEWAMSDSILSVYKKELGWLELTPLEFKFLKYLIERKGTIISKDRLLKDVWGFSFLPKTRTVDYLLTQLRKRLEPNPDSPQHLLTVRGAGIKFLE